MRFTSISVADFKARRLHHHLAMKQFAAAAGQAVWSRRRVGGRNVSLLMAMSLGVEVVALRPACAQASAPGGLSSSNPTLRSLLVSAGPAWMSAESRHFVVHVERRAGAIAPAQMLDSLEAAWNGAVVMLGVPVGDSPRADVVVTASRTRFPRLLSPAAKGLTTRSPDGSEIVILVQNDSVRAYARHEVMHIVAWRAWGARGRTGAWLVEGLATFADPRCQASNITVVGRDLLRAQPSLTATEVTRDFLPLWQADRARAYVLAGTLVDYLWTSRGRDGVRRLWQGADSLEESAMVPGLAGALTTGWRAHLARVAGNAPGLDTTMFRRLGCG
jgi:hypothetical protein